MNTDANINSGPNELYQMPDNLDIDPLKLNNREIVDKPI